MNELYINIQRTGGFSPLVLFYFFKLSLYREKALTLHLGDDRVDFMSN